MIPEMFHRVNPRTLTPIPNTIIVAVVISLLAGLIPINFLAEMTSIGTLVAFITVAIGVIVLRQRHPDLPRSFKVPLYPVIPILAILGSLWIIYEPAAGHDLRLRDLGCSSHSSGISSTRASHSHLGRHEHVGLAAEERLSHDDSRRVPHQSAGQGGAQPGRHAGAFQRRGTRRRARSSRHHGCPACPGRTRGTEATSTSRPRPRWPRPVPIFPRTCPQSSSRFTPGRLPAAWWRRPSSTTPASSRWDPPTAGQFGYITLSSVADRLLHSSPIPVAVAPRGFRAKGGKVERVTLAYTGGKQSGVAAGRRRDVGRQVRRSSCGWRRSPSSSPHPKRLGSVPRARRCSPNGPRKFAPLPRKSWRPKASGASRRPEPEFVIGHGQDWEEAFDDVEWRAGDVLVIGSSESGPVSRVFLGSRATKIVRHAPVPVLVVPRAAAKELAKE